MSEWRGILVAKAFIILFFPLLSYCRSSYFSHTFSLRVRPGHLKAWAGLSSILLLPDRELWVFLLFSRSDSLSDNQSNMADQDTQRIMGIFVVFQV